MGLSGSHTKLSWEEERRGGVAAFAASQEELQAIREARAKDIKELADSLAKCSDEERDSKQKEAAQALMEVAETLLIQQCEQSNKAKGMPAHLLVSRKSVESAPAPITSGTSGDGQGQGARGFDIEGAIGQWLKESQAYKEEQRRQKEEERQARERELAQQKEMGEK
mmetsp:Transcript_31696/g.90047  ORF Transcript_31696/g.90047 Transcript_31696/m.90047 type:complete len:167 (+) Transcript_31696:200-700(+)